MIVSKYRHTEPSLVNLFGCKGEYRDYFDHYLDDHLSHRRSRRNVGINRESSEKVLDAFEDIDYVIVTCPHIFGRLAILDVTRSRRS